MIKKYITNIILYTIIGMIVGVLIESIVDIESVFMFMARMIHDHAVVVIGMIAGFIIGITSIINYRDEKMLMKDKEVYDNE